MLMALAMPAAASVISTGVVEGRRAAIMLFLL
jgi:hypothetical protein